MSLSPMMQQYHQAKEAAGDALLLFRMGDFYELFYEDAKTAARVLGLSLTSRDKGENPIPMAGFPYHQLDPYLAKIIAAGHRAAICEQMENPKEAKARGGTGGKSIVKRAITRVVSRGTVTDDSLLDPQSSNYLAALVVNKSDDRVGLAWVDLSTGVFVAAPLAAPNVADQLARVAPAELLVSDDQRDELPPAWIAGRTATTRPAWAFGQKQAVEILTRHFGTQTLDGFGFDTEAEYDRMALAAAGAILEYLTETQKTDLSHIATLVAMRQGESLEIDAATWRSLEITQTLRDGRRDGSLLGVLDRTTTPMGARRLGEWLAHPLIDTDAIEARLDAVAELVAHPQLSAAVRDTLKSIYDVQRLIARVTTGRAGPRDLSCVG